MASFIKSNNRAGRPGHKNMKKFETILNQWQSTLCKEVALGALYSRNPTVHKWKMPHRCLVLRELVSWRVIDLLNQVLVLQKENGVLGARILLRSAIETLALLIYMNQKIESIVALGQGFHEFSKATSRLLLGSRNKTTSHDSINILTVLDKCEKKYSGIVKIYADLSESAHPNWEGMGLGYSTVEHSNHVTKFENRWSENFGDKQAQIVELIMRMFEVEYNEVWPANFDKLEDWIFRNDESLELTKKGN